ncbi:hypothetical protein [Nonomuraea sp. NPDC049709]|uniref:hypothetical protein n=1 Tax=Nonomuraea sp. NPDC049709 TaxID=3154736 RepID=UPI003413E508
MRKQARRNVTNPRQQVELVRRRLPCGDYGVEIAGTLHAAGERKSLAVWWGPSSTPGGRAAS